MALVTVSVGSNINREHNVRLALQALRDQYGEIRISPVYETEAVGFDGDDFLNLVVAFNSDQPPDGITVKLKNIEDCIGRDRQQPRFSARMIDLDLLTYDDLVCHDEDIQLPREEILKHAFVLKPLSDLIPEERHPLAGKTYLQLWNEMRNHAERIEEIELEIG
jgi:2-amino-4-hydroxy-6-hydroxymethyldihydropteridine diphosphokinase